MVGINTTWHNKCQLNNSENDGAKVQKMQIPFGSTSSLPPKEKQIRSNSCSRGKQDHAVKERERL